uniref:Phospholipid/glycerol acyltransferase domain-containing protein n=1 Tax=Felis catus TaxID=9685 RepID=A0ABI7XR37_FELCA
LARPTFLGKNRARNEEGRVFTYSTNALEHRQRILQSSSRSSTKRNISATRLHLSQHIFPLRSRKPCDQRHGTGLPGLCLVPGHRKEVSPARPVGGAGERQEFTNGPGGAQARSERRGRRRKRLLAAPEGAGRQAVHGSTRSGLPPVFVFFFTGCSWGRTLAAEISPLPWVAEPPKGSRRCSRVRASRLRPSRQRRVGPPLVLRFRRAAPHQCRGALSRQDRESRLGEAVPESPAVPAVLGYEVHGMEKIPEEGPALIIFYHGAIPIDFYYFMAKIFIHKGRTCRVVADHFVFKIPGFSLLLDVFCALHGPREKCVEILRSGHLLAISPGGVREALISDETYNIIWGNRKGFAQVAIDAKVPIIPMFTQNIREGFRSLGGTRLFRWLYEKFRYPFAPMYGGFPVKLRTYLGEPIPYDPKITAEELAEKMAGDPRIPTLRQ